MRTLHLDTEYDFSFALYGIVATCKDYKMAWSLNRLLGLSLVRQQELCYHLPDCQTMYISNFEHNGPHSTVRLFRNKAVGTTTVKNPFLLPDSKEYDFIMQITGAMQQYLKPQELRNLTLVQYIKQLDRSHLRTKNTYYSDI